MLTSDPSSIQPLPVGARVNDGPHPGEQLRQVQQLLEQKNRHLAELYDAAHHFVDQVSRQFRTPLGVIQEFTAILREELPGRLNSEQREYLDIIAERVDELTLRVNDMLDIRRLEGGLLGVVRRRCRVEEIVCDARPLLKRRASRSNLTLDVQVHESLPEVYGDAQTLGRIITNLTVFALGDGHEGGRVVLDARLNDAESQVIISVSRPQSEPCPSETPFKNASATIQQDADSPRTDGEAEESTLGLEVAEQLAHLNLSEITVRQDPSGAVTWLLHVPVADPTVLIPCYLGSLQRLKRRPSHVSLIAARVDIPTDSPLARTIDDFLQRLLRCTDWVYQAGPAVWLLSAAGGGTGEMDKVVTRVYEAWEEAGWHRRHGEWPRIQLDVLGTWTAADPELEFTRRFLAEADHTIRKAMNR